MSSDANASGTDPLPTDQPNAAPPTVAALFRGFFILGLTGFGGVLPMSRRMLVEHRKWLSPTEFTNLLGLCQFLPGGNVMNLSVAVGMRFRGVSGAAASLIGLIAAPSAIVLLLGTFYQRCAAIPQVQHFFAGLAAAAAGLLIALAVKLALPLRRQPVPAGFAVLCFLAIAVFRLPLLPTMLSLSAISIMVRRWSRW